MAAETESRADGLCGRPGGVQADLCHLSGGTHNVQRLAQNGHMVGGILDVCNGFLDLAAECFDGAGSSLGNGRIGIRGLLGGFQSIGIFFCGLGGFLLSNYSLIQGLLSFIRCGGIFPKRFLQVLIALT